MDQLKYAFGLTEEEYWFSRYNKVFTPKELKKLQLIETPYENQDSLSVAQKREMIQIFKVMSPLVNDPIIYGLMLLLLVTQPIDGISMGPLAKLHSRCQFH